MSAPGQATAPQGNVAQLREKLSENARRARDEVPRLTDPRAQALFETAAEVLDGLAKACKDYDAGTEPAWRH